MGKEAKHGEPVVHGEHHDAPASEAGAIIAWLRAIASHKSTAVEIDQHGQVILVRGGRCPHVQVEAVLAHAAGTKAHIAKEGQLHGSRAKLVGFAHPRPVDDRLRRPPPQLTDRRCRKGDPFEAAKPRIWLRSSFDDAIGRHDAIVSEETPALYFLHGNNSFHWMLMKLHLRAYPKTGFWPRTQAALDRFSDKLLVSVSD